VEVVAEILAKHPRGVVMARDELSGFALGMGQYKGGRGADKQFYLTRWTGKADTIDRMSRRTYIPESVLCIVGAIPPDVLSDLCDERGREDGFLHRFLFAWDTPVPVRWTDATVDVDVYGRYRTMLGALFELQETKTLTLDSGARGIFVEFFNYVHERAEAVATPAQMRGPLAKMPSQVARLALVIHTCRWITHESGAKECEVDADSMNAAVTLAEYFISTAERVYAHLTTRPEDALIVNVLEWMREKRLDSVTHRDILRARVGGLSSSAAARDALAEMQKRGLGIVTDEPIRGGRRMTFTLTRTVTTDATRTP
jgi:hypothetical protein